MEALCLALETKGISDCSAAPGEKAGAALKLPDRGEIRTHCPTPDLLARRAGLGRDSGLRLRGGSRKKGLKAAGEVSWRAVSGNLLGGLTLFLFSMDKLSEGIQAACGDELKSVLKNLTFNRYVGFLTGMGACAITNSLRYVKRVSIAQQRVYRPKELKIIQTQRASSYQPFHG